VAAPETATVGLWAAFRLACFVMQGWSKRNHMFRQPYTLPILQYSEQGVLAPKATGEPVSSPHCFSDQCHTFRVGFVRGLRLFPLISAPTWLADEVYSAVPTTMHLRC